MTATSFPRIPRINDQLTASAIRTFVNDVSPYASAKVSRTEEGYAFLKKLASFCVRAQSHFELSDKTSVGKLRKAAAQLVLEADERNAKQSKTTNAKTAPKPAKANTEPKDIAADSTDKSEGSGSEYVDPKTVGQMFDAAFRDTRRNGDELADTESSMPNVRKLLGTAYKSASRCTLVAYPIAMGAPVILVYDKYKLVDVVSYGVVKGTSEDRVESASSDIPRSLNAKVMFEGVYRPKRLYVVGILSHNLFGKREDTKPVQDPDFVAYAAFRGDGDSFAFLHQDSRVYEALSERHSEGPSITAELSFLASVGKFRTPTGCLYACAFGNGSQSIDGPLWPMLHSAVHQHARDVKTVSDAFDVSPARRKSRVSTLSLTTSFPYAIEGYYCRPHLEETHQKLGGVLIVPTPAQLTKVPAKCEGARLVTTRSGGARVELKIRTKAESQSMRVGVEDYLSVSGAAPRLFLVTDEATGEKYLEPASKVNSAVGSDNLKKLIHSSRCGCGAKYTAHSNGEGHIRVMCHNYNCTARGGAHLHYVLHNILKLNIVPGVFDALTDAGASSVTSLLQIIATSGKLRDIEATLSAKDARNLKRVVEVPKRLSVLTPYMQALASGAFWDSSSASPLDITNSETLEGLKTNKTMGPVYDCFVRTLKKAVAKTS